MFDWLSLEAVALIVALSAIALVFIYSLILGTPPTPTSPKVLARLTVALPTLGPGTVYELGSGWGGVATKLARTYPDHVVVAIEASPLPCLVAALRRWFFGPANLQVRLGSFWNYRLDDAAAVVAYLQTDVMEKLRPKFESELRPGTVIITHTFRVPQWEPFMVYDTDDLYKTPIYLYEIEENGD
ncbi:MAG: class I SAM-dependent methyltransferase [Proteobacteria bacterium]|nr:class I SAM-dependent methyltransferase [Pseudomonadota bacterium]